MKAIVGLGNPGLRYRLTRHNVGFLVVKELSRTLRIRLRQKTYQSLIGKGRVGQEELLLAMPQTFMNLSGQALSAMVKSKKLKPEDILVVCDDVNLPLGKIRLRKCGSEGGHKGLRSIIKEIGSTDFSRIRIGVGLPQTMQDNIELSSYVLSRFNRKEMEMIDRAVSEAARCCEIWIKEGITCAMNNCN